MSDGCGSTSVWTSLSNTDVALGAAKGQSAPAGKGSRALDFGTDCKTPPGHQLRAAFPAGKHPDLLGRPDRGCQSPAGTGGICWALAASAPTRSPACSRGLRQHHLQQVGTTLTPKSASQHPGDHAAGRFHSEPMSHSAQPVN